MREVRYFKDPEFRRGIDILCASHGVEKEFRGNVYFDTECQEKPWWVGAQHFSRFEIIGTEPVMKNGMFGYHNDGKVLAVYDAEDGHRAIHLSVFGKNEYGDETRDDRGNWPHLLIGGEFREETPVFLREYKSLVYTMDVRILNCVNRMTPETYREADHCAQTTAYLTLQNIDEDSPGFGEFIWFGIPIFDSRHRFPDPFRLIDGDPEEDSERKATGAVIDVLGGEAFLQEKYGGVNPADGEWATVTVDILPYVRETLTQAKAKGLMRHTEVEQLGMGSFNIGWEIPGVFDCSMELKNIQLTGYMED